MAASSRATVDTTAGGTAIIAPGTYIDGALLGIGLNEPTYPAGTATMATRPT